MATLHQISTAAVGDRFESVGPVTIDNQFPPRTAKGGRVYSAVQLRGAGGYEIRLGLWDDAALWKLPLIELTLHGKFVKDAYLGGSLKCEDLKPPIGAKQLQLEDVRPEEGKELRPKMSECLDAGIRASEWVTKKGKPELSEAAFAFACRAVLDGVRIE